VLSEARSIAEAAPKLLKVICESLDWELGALWIIDASVDGLVCQDVWHRGSHDAEEFKSLTREVAFPADIGLPGRVWSRRKPAWIADVVKDPNFPRAGAAARVGLHGAFGFPIQFGGDVLGVVEFFSREIREPDAALLEMAGAAGEQIGQFLSRKQAEQDLEKSQRVLAEFVENAVFGVFQTTADGRFISANAAMARILGYGSPAELVATISDIRTQVHVDPARRDEFAATLERDGAVQGFEAQARRRDGGLIWLSLSGRAVRDGTGALLHFEGMAEDVTERRRAEEALRSSEEQAELARQRVWVLAEASAILGASLDYEATMARLAKLSVKHLADWCAIDVLDEDETIRRIAVLHPDPAKMELAAALQERYPPPAEGQRGVSHVISSGKSEFYREITDELLQEAAEDAEHLEILRGLGISSAICAPLLGFGRILGAITLVAESSRRRYDEDDVALAEDLGRRAGVAIENARLYRSEQRVRAAAEDSKAIAQEAQDRFWFLAEASAALSASLDYETTMNRVTRFAVPFLADCCSVHIFPTDTTPARSAVTHSDLEKEYLVRELHRDYPPREGDDHPILRLIESQTSVIVHEIIDAAVQEIVRDERHLKLLQELGFVSYMAVPLIARSRLFGAVTFASATPERRYDKTHLALAEELAGRAALALDNAHLYEESQEVQEALRVAGEAKDEFLGMMSHELRTPITAIYGGARLLRARGARLDEEKKSAIMYDIEHESERLFRMVENLLVLSRLELGQEAATEPVMAQRVTEKAVSQFRGRRPTREITFDFDSDTPPVAAQSAYLELVLRNLLSNADKYSPAESPIELQMKRGTDEVEIAVGDRGPGITEEEEEIIFDRFYRSERTSGRASGIGMGLTVCKRLIEAQSGRVWARRREGGGLEITFTLPYYKEELG